MKHQPDFREETTPEGFEPSRAEPNGFLVHRHNRSDTVSPCSTGLLQQRSTLLIAKFGANLRKQADNRIFGPKKNDSCGIRTHALTD